MDLYYPAAGYDRLRKRIAMDKRLCSGSPDKAVNRRGMVAIQYNKRFHAQAPITDYANIIIERLEFARCFSCSLLLLHLDLQKLFSCADRHGRLKAEADQDVRGTNRLSKAESILGTWMSQNLSRGRRLAWLMAGSCWRSMTRPPWRVRMITLKMH
ncbi:hypothetical protein BOW51_11970 [Solemya velesiana gill symbiont]|uniref:Uncharacterized protein n=1 Tax=Solemya velesiana gill symbiont TaxID=1918948 RepID=A0A1T2KP79_9GAMM|nr:hypothetical protein BOW51_11970 [Solemya velesiana gill symbiont]